MFERFTTEARQVVVLAQQEARQLRHDCLGTEHLLLGLLGGGRGPAATVLSGHGLTVERVRTRLAALTGDGLDPDALAVIGIDLDEVRRVTEASFGPGALEGRGGRPMKTGHLPVCKRAKKVLELSLREALQLGHNHISSGHVLLGLLREGEGLGAKLLADAGLDFGELREEITPLLPTRAA